MKGIWFVPYPGMTVIAFRGDDEVEAEIVHAYQKNAKLRWADDKSLSIFVCHTIKSGQLMKTR